MTNLTTGIPKGIATFNICNFAPALLEKGVNAEQELGWAAKKNQVFAATESAFQNADIVCLQELRNRNPGDCMIGEFWDRLGPQQIKLDHAEFNASQLSFMIATAYKSDKFWLNRSFKFWNNPENPDQFGDHPAGNGWGRVSLISEFFPMTVNAKGVPVPDYEAPPIYVVNKHLGLKHLERESDLEITVKKMEGIAKRGHIFVVGDFNRFPDDKGDEEMAILAQAGYEDLTKVLTTHDGLDISGKSFLGRKMVDKNGQLVDRFIPPNGKLGANLDAIFYKAVNVRPFGPFNTYADLRKHNGKDEIIGAKSSEELLLSASGEDLRNEYPSDHPPIITRFERMTQDESKE